MGLLDWMRGRQSASRLEALPAQLPKVEFGSIEGVSTAKAGFMSGTDGKPSLTWARYSAPQLSAGYWPHGRGAYWGVPGSEVARERAHIAQVALDLLTSNPKIAALVENLSTYAIGNGLTLSSKPDAEALGITPEVARELSHRIERAWAQWVGNPLECDASSRHNVHQLAVAAFKSWLMQGESVLLLDWQRGNGARTATKVKLLDPRQIDMAVTRVTEIGNASQGVQFDKTGRMIGFWMRPFELGNSSYAAQPEFVRARTSWGRPRAVHLFDLLIPGQMRGLSPLAAALSPAHAVATMKEFALDEALVHSMVSTTIESDLPANKALQSFAVNDQLQGFPAGLTPEEWVKSHGDYYAESKVTLQPGVISHLYAGDKLKVHRSEAPNATFDPFVKALSRDAAKAAGSSYEDLSGDFSSTSFSASRLAMELPHRINKRRRSAIVEPFYRNIYAAWLEEATETGVVELPKGAPAFWERPDAYTQSVWRGDGKPVSDPLKAAQADVLELQNGFSTLEAKLAERGQDFEETLAQLTSEIAQFEAKGLVHPYANKVPIIAAPDQESTAAQ